MRRELIRATFAELALVSRSSLADAALMMMTRRLIQLLVGLTLYGASTAMMLRAELPVQIKRMFIGSDMMDSRWPRCS